MVLRCSEIDGTQKPPPAPATAGQSMSLPFENNTRTRRTSFQPISDHGDRTDRHPSSASPSPPPTLHQAKNDPSPSSGSSFSVSFKNPKLRWGSNRRMRCQLVSDHRDRTDRRPSSASPSPPPTSHQSKNDPSPSSGRRPRLLIRIPCRNQPKDPERDGPPAPEERPDNRQETREAASGGAPLQNEGPVARPLTRSLTSRTGTRGKEKRGNNVRPAEFSISLSNEEIMEDFIAMTGAKPPSRPKKRSRALQNNLNEIFPGSQLPNIMTAGRY